MKRLNWQVVLGLVLVGVSAGAYAVHFLVFRDAHHIFIYLVGDIAFVPIEVLLVTLIIHRVLSARERRSKLQKLNMVVGTFFSEVGTALLGLFSRLDRDAASRGGELRIAGDWPARRFAELARRLRGADFHLDWADEAVGELRAFLSERRGFLLGLLANPNLLEHDRFTDLLWAVFHLTDELSHRADLADLPAGDREHLLGDVRRAYGRLVAEWLMYMRHLCRSYPYLFSLAIRTSPFDPAARVVVA